MSNSIKVFICFCMLFLGTIVYYQGNVIQQQRKEMRALLYDNLSCKGIKVQEF